MKRIWLCVGVLICATALFSGCVPEHNRDSARVNIIVDWRVDPDHQGYYISRDRRHHGDREHPVYRYTPVWRGDSDHPGYYIPRDHDQRGDRDHPVYNNDHHGDGHKDSPDRKGDNRGSSNNVQNQDSGEQAIRQYAQQHALPVHISSIEQLTDPTPTAATAPSVKRYKVIDGVAGTEAVVVYNANTGALALE
ncbi:MAG TPA: hypothetical protein VGL77_11380 [Armatimonadota bacterium]